MDVAALDLGSNSFHLLVARVSGERVEKLDAEKRTLGLGAHVRRHGCVPREAMAQALEAVEALVSRAREFSRATVAAVGTSWLREATNGHEFVHRVQQRTAVTVDVLSGTEEAELCGEGARSALTELPSRVAVLDLGGGSVEVALARPGHCQAVGSAPVGFLKVGRISESADSSAWTGLRAQVEQTAGALLAEARSCEPLEWVLSGGTARAFGAVLHRLAGVGPRAIPVGIFRSMASQVAQASPEALNAIGVDESRVPIFGTGAALLATLAELAGASAISISPGGLREGVALRQVRRSQAEERRPSSSSTGRKLVLAASC